MMKFNISKEAVIGVAKAVGSCLALGVLVKYVPCCTNRMSVTSDDDFHMPCYGEAVRVIMKEFTFDSHRNEALKHLKRDGDAAYYMAVIEAIKGSTFDSSRIELIKTLSEK